MSDVIVGRKPRITGISKQIRKLGKKIIYQWGIPIFRYSLIPGMLFFSINYTEPEPTILELLNPFF